MITLFVLGILLVAAYPIVVCHFRLAFTVFLTLSPLYYVPFLFIATGHSDEFFWLRAGKDMLLLFFITAWIVRGILQGKLVWRTDVTSVSALALLCLGLYMVLRLSASDHGMSARMLVLNVPFLFVARDVFRDSLLMTRQITNWVYMSGVVSIVGLIEFVYGGADNVFSQAAGQVRIISTLFSPNALGWYLVFSNAMILGLLATRNRRSAIIPTAPVLTALLLLNMVAIVLTGSRSALIVFGLLSMFTFVLARPVFVVKALPVISLLGIAFAFGYDRYDLGAIRVFSGLDTSRWYIYRIVFESFRDVSLWELAFGLGRDRIVALRYAGLIDDSFVLLLFAHGGAFAVGVMTAIAFATVSWTVRGAMRNGIAARSVLLAVGGFVLLATISNVLMLFPHALLFWVVVGMAWRQHWPRPGASVLA
jgi:hypothetical protein